MATPVVAHAQFGIAAGLSVPGAQLGDESATGFNVTGMYNVPSRFPIGFRGEAGLSSFSLKGTAIGTTRIVNLTGNIIGALPSIGNAGPYIIAGVGVYRVNYSSGSKDYLLPAQTPLVSGRNGTDDRMGLNAGAGMSLPFGSIGMLIEARYVNLASSSRHPSASFIPISIGFLF